MDYSLIGSFVRGISQARTLEWVAISSSRGSFWPKDQTCVSCVSCIGKWILYHWTSEDSLKPYCMPSNFSCVSLHPHGLSPARLLCPWNSPGKNTELVAMPSSRGSSWPRDWTMSPVAPVLAGRYFTPAEAPIIAPPKLVDVIKIMMLHDVFINHSLHLFSTLSLIL